VLSFATVVWGEMVPMYLEATLPSLLQPGNLPTNPALWGTYTFYASDEARRTITHHPLYRRLEAVVVAQWLPLQQGEWHVNANIRHHLELAASEGAHSALLPPDEVFGNGSLANLAYLAQEGYNPILWGYPKVTGEGFGAITGALARRGTLSNRELVSLSMPHIVGGAYQVTPCPGSGPAPSWQVTHRVPAPCLKADDKILAFWRDNPMHNGGHDHVLPWWMIQARYPWYLVRHSDEYFQVELSTGWAGFPPSSNPRGWLPQEAEAYEQWASGFTQTWQGIEE